MQSLLRSMICGDCALRFQQPQQFFGLGMHELDRAARLHIERIRGSVFDVRKLNRHSGNSNDTPSVRSRTKACGA